MSERILPTLSEFFTQSFVPIWIDGKQLDSKTKASYSESIGWWVELSGDPSLSAVDDLVVARFISDLSKQRGKSVGTTMKRSSIGKHCRQLDTVLKMTGPRTRANRLGQRLLLEPPFLDSPKCEKNPPKSVWSIDELRAMYAAADTMEDPKVDGISAPQWWRSLITLGWFLGLRIYSLLHFTPAMIEGSWLNLTAEISKGGKGTRHYVHHEALAHIKAIARGADEPILCYPQWTKSKRMAYDYFRQLQSSAGIAEHRRFGFHGLRKAHTTMYANLGANQQQGLRMAQQSVGHANIELTRDVYVSTDIQDQWKIDTINRFPSPCVRPAEPVRLPERMDKMVRRAVEMSNDWIY